jgi:hypothetical protein
MAEESSAAAVAVSEPRRAQKAEALATPEQHAIATGNARRYMPAVAFGGAGESPMPRETLGFSAEHAAAAALHGWALHEHQEGEPIKISADAYAEALKAAAHPVTRLVPANGKASEPLDAAAVAEFQKSRAANKSARGDLVTDYEPHDAALSKHSHLAQLRKAAEAK